MSSLLFFLTNSIAFHCISFAFISIIFFFLPNHHSSENKHIERTRQPNFNISLHCPPYPEEKLHKNQIHHTLAAEPGLPCRDIESWLGHFALVPRDACTNPSDRIRRLGNISQSHFRPDRPEGCFGRGQGMTLSSLPQDDDRSCG